MRVASLVNGAHSTSAKRLNDLKVVEVAVYQIFLAAFGANNSGQRFVTAGIKRCATNPAGLGRHETAPSIHMEIDCNIDEFEGKKVTVAG